MGLLICLCHNALNVSTFTTTYDDLIEGFIHVHNLQINDFGDDRSTTANSFKIVYDCIQTTMKQRSRTHKYK